MISVIPMIPIGLTAPGNRAHAGRMPSAAPAPASPTAATAAIFARHGNPLEVLETATAELPAPGPGEALVSGILAPINPADLNTIEGSYPARPPLPGTPGVEGAGRVAAVGPGVTESTGIAPGTVVLLPHGYGTWREAGIVDAASLTPVPPDVPFHEAAMLKINPATAWRMLHDFVEPQPGAWVIQNAANSAVGRHVIAIARELGLRTVNLVRRAELAHELVAAGADAVLLDDDSARDAIAEATENAPILLALNAVGGESAMRLAGALAHGGTLVTYGAMSRQAIKVPAGQLIFKDLRYRGFWVSHWYREADPADRQAMFLRLFDLARMGLLRTPVERVYPVSQLREAVARAMEGGRNGKILLGSPEDARAR